MPTRLLSPGTYARISHWLLRDIDDNIYTPMPAGSLQVAELPGSLPGLPSSWLRVHTYTPAIPSTDTIVGIEVLISAWTDDPDAQIGPPGLEDEYTGSTDPIPTPEEAPGGGGEGGGGEELPGGGGLEPMPLSPEVPGGGIGVSPPPGTHWYPLEVALSLDGVNPVGETWNIYPDDTITEHTCGGAAYLWNYQPWWPISFGDSFSVLVRRPVTSPAVSSHYVTSARVQVTTTSSGGSLTDMRQTLTEHVLLGAEATPGTIASTFRRLRALNYRSRPNVNMKKFRPQGEKMNAVSVPTREWATGNISGLMDYNELPIALESIIGEGVHSGAGVADQRNIHVYSLENRIRHIGKTYSLQRGEKASRAHQHLHLVHTGLQLQINTQDCQVSGAWFGQKITDGVTMFEGDDEVQSISITGVPTGGTFRLAFRGAETADLAYNITAVALQTALQALSTIGAGNALVAGTTPYVVTFADDLAAENQPMIVLAKNQLTGGTSPSVTIAQTTRGGWAEYALQPVLPQHWSIYLADTQATLLANKLDKTVGVAATGIDVADRYNPFWTLDRAQGTDFTDVTEMDPKFAANLTVGANSVGMGLLTPLRSGATKWLRMEAEGPVIGATSDPHKMIWEGPVKLSDTADFGDEDGRVVYPWALEWCEGPNGEVPTLTIENGVVSY